MSDAEAAVAALRSGRLVVIPTDTVYGLSADGRSKAAAAALYRAKGRGTVRPTALLFATFEVLAAEVPELPTAALAVARALLPGPVTLVLPNPARRFAWLNGDRPEAIGTRVPALTGAGRAVLQAVGVLVATSANLPGGPDPRRRAAVPAELVAAAAAAGDGGELAGVPSTVFDVTGTEPRVVREGALPATDALARIRAAVLTDR